jgi:hypothetical protein
MEPTNSVCTNTPALRPTLHAAVRYAQRVLQLTVTARDLVRDQALRKRCERGLMRIAQDVLLEGPQPVVSENGRVRAMVLRHRMLIVCDDTIVTVMVSDHHGFRKAEVARRVRMRQAA